MKFTKSIIFTLILLFLVTNCGLYDPTVDARMGRCVIWPAAFTHLHRSELPNKGLKYIVTGWISLN